MGARLLDEKDGVPVDDDTVTAAEPQPPLPGPPAPRPPAAGTILTLVTGVLSGVGGVYAGTHSLTVTVIAAIAAIVLAAMVLAGRR
jgi:hypothetical protein